LTTSVNPTLTDIENIFTDVVWTPLVKGAEVALDAAEATIPILDWGITQDIEAAAINAITNAVLSRLLLFIDVSAIQFLDAELQSKWTSASESLALIATEQGANSNAYKTALASAASDFAKWVNTSGQ